MADFIPSAAQKVIIASRPKQISGELQNAMDAIVRLYTWRAEQTDEVQAEMDKIATVTELEATYNQIKGWRNTLKTRVLAYEGTDELPTRDDAE